MVRHGTKPDDGTFAPEQVIAPLEQRVHDVGYTLVAGFPLAKRHHDATRLSPVEHARLDRVLTAVVAAGPLDPEVTASRVLGRSLRDPGVKPFLMAGAVLQAAASYADLRHATDLIARSAMDMGLDRFKPFLKEADEHLARNGGMPALTQLVAKVTAPAFKAPSAVIVVPVRSMLTPERQPMVDGPNGSEPHMPPARSPTVPLAIGAAALAAIGLSVLAARELMRDVGTDAATATAKRSGLDLSKPTDAAAALAYNWAKGAGAKRLGLSNDGPAAEDGAQRVMRAAQADPALFGKAVAGDKAALATLTAAAQQTAPGSGLETLNDEEHELVASLASQGKSNTEILAALDALRAKRGTFFPIARQKQDGHLRGTPQSQNRLKMGGGTSLFDGDQAEADALTREAWSKGSSPDKRDYIRDYNFGRRIGTSPRGDAQTIVRVHRDATGRLHGHPRGS